MKTSVSFKNQKIDPKSLKLIRDHNSTITIQRFFKENKFMCEKCNKCKMRM